MVANNAVVAAERSSVKSQRPSLDKMWQILQAQQKQINKLKRQNRRLSSQLEAVASVLDSGENRSGSLANNKAGTKSKIKSKSEKYPSKALSANSHHSARSKLSAKTTIGGYGEMHYNNTASGKEIDFHRFVLFFGHRFNDRLSFFSELEVEHALAGEGQPGEVEIEQAYINYAISDRLSAKGGLFLVPIGILNETHEPNTFYGVERNPVEKNIIPSTWWEAGTMLSGQVGNKGWSYDLALHSGLKLTSAKSYAIRSGRQKGAQAIAEDYGVTARIKWSGRPGLTIAATIQYQDNAGQSLDSNIGNAKLFESNLSYRHKGFGFRALYAQWDVDGSGPKSIGADKQQGWYIEPSYKFNNRVGVFARYNEWDNLANSTSDSKKKQWDVGVNYWLSDSVALKFDVQDQSGATDDDGFNLGIGFQF